MDSRKALKPDERLYGYKNKKETGEAIEFRIVREIGRGGSCIVYDGEYKDSVGLKHFSRLKECYPYKLKLIRNKTGRIYPEKGEEEKFNQEKEKFLQVCQKHTEIRAISGLVNATANVIEIYFSNGTIYMVMDYDEGENYSQIQNETIQETLKRVKAAAVVLEKYHHSGYLHLDIKPENIWIFPETNDYVRFFDFDSIVAKNDLLDKNSPDERNLFCTEGFAAPELILGNRRQISEATDIYSIGALLFYKLMGRIPGRQEREFHANYNFSQLENKNPLCQPLFFRRLGGFFRKTLIASPSRRLNRIEDVITLLDELISLSDTEAIYPVNNFSYHQNHFIGRTEERQDIKEKFQQKHVLFLHGIGGIGKTELAMFYAYENADDYDRILFLRYEHSLLESLCGEDISLCHFHREDEEDDYIYWNRKLAVLKQILTDRDLLILDNFDTEEDEKLEEFLEIPCHILITSRCDFRDFNYPQIEITEFKRMQDLLALFRVYNNREYSDDEIKAIEKIIEAEERHTMLVELTAKNLRVSEMSPIELFERFKLQQTIINMEENSIGHRKDKKRRKISVQNHLRILFDVTNFQETEYYILENLSLFSGVRMKQEQFLKWCTDCSAKNLESLIHRGWIERNEQEDKISLHQVIVDLIYDARKPDGEICSTLTQSMTGYIKKKGLNRTERETRNRLLNIFGTRIYPNLEQQKNSAEKKKYVCTAEFYLAYCEKIQYKDQWFSFCKREYKKNEKYHQNELAALTYLQAEHEFEKLDDIEYFGEEELQLDILQNILNGFQKAIQYKKKGVNEQPKLLGDFLFEIGRTCKGKTESSIMGDNILVIVYQFIAKCLEDGAAYYKKGYLEGKEAEKDNFEKKYSGIENDRKDKREDFEKENAEKRHLIAMYQELIEFYSPDFPTLTRPAQFEDITKTLHYSNLIEELEPSIEMTEKEKIRIHIHSNVISYAAAGENAVINGEYEKALQYFEIALENQESEYFSIRKAIADVYEKMDRTKEALEYYQVYADEIGFSDFDIGRLYRKLGQYQKAEEWFNQGLDYCDRKIADIQIEDTYLVISESGDWKNEKLKGYLEMSRLPGKRGKQALHKGIEYYQQEIEWFREGSSMEFQIAYAKALLEKKNQTELYPLLRNLYHNCLENYQWSKIEELRKLLEEFLTYVEDLTIRSHILFLIVELLEEEKYPPDFIKEEEYCQEALSFLMENGQDDTVLLMRVMDKLDHIYRELNQDEKAEQYRKSCDYELIAIEEEQKLISDEKKNFNQDRQSECTFLGDDLKEKSQNQNDIYAKSMEIWMETGAKYEDGEKLEKAISCYLKAKSKWQQLNYVEKIEQIYSYGYIMDWLFLRKKEQKDGEGCQNILLEWHEELIGLYQHNFEDAYKLSYEWDRIIQDFIEYGDSQMAIRCFLEKGLIQLNVPCPKIVNRENTILILAKHFFAKIEEGILAKQTDYVLEICDGILKLLFGVDAMDKMGNILQESCQKVIHFFREKEITFKHKF